MVLNSTECSTQWWSNQIDSGVYAAFSSVMTVAPGSIRVVARRVFTPVILDVLRSSRINVDPFCGLVGDVNHHQTVVLVHSGPHLLEHLVNLGLIASPDDD
jgi:hypothetical protein